MEDSGKRANANDIESFESTERAPVDWADVVHRAEHLAEHIRSPEADDAVEPVVLRCYRRWSRGLLSEVTNAYLIRAIRRAITDERKMDRSDLGGAIPISQAKLHDTEPDEGIDSEEIAFDIRRDPEKTAIARAFLIVVERAVRKRWGERGFVLLRMDADGDTSKEIAEAVGLTEGNVRVQLSRIRKWLREWNIREGNDL